MAAQSEPEIVLYDLACTKNLCFSPVVWRIRLILNYKQIPYKTVFLEFPDIEPTLKGLGLSPHPSTSASARKYTVPAIQHLPSSTYMMDSFPIAQFLESTYPDPPLLITLSLGDSLEAQAHAAIGPALRTSVMPREANILSERAGAYFRQSREAALGHRLEDLLDSDKEEQAWKAAGAGMRAISELMATHKDDGPFVLGARPSYADFRITGVLQAARMVDEGVWKRIVAYPGFGGIYEGCLPYMEKKD